MVPLCPGPVLSVAQITGKVKSRSIQWQDFPAGVDGPREHQVQLDQTRPRSSRRLKSAFSWPASEPIELTEASRPVPLQKSMTGCGLRFSRIGRLDRIAVSSGFRLRPAELDRLHIKVPLAWEDGICLRSCPHRAEGTFKVNNTVRRPKITVSAQPIGLATGHAVIVRRERPHLGAQLRFTDINGHRFTAFLTGARRGQLADLELRHRHRARCEDRIRNAKDTGLRNLPLHG
jgi:hypothetical protein